MKKVKKFLFIVPNSRWFGKRCWLWFTPAVSFLVPILKNYGLKVELLEANIDDLSPEQMKKRIQEIQPDVVEITNMSLEYWKQAHEAAKVTKEIDKEIANIKLGEREKYKLMNQAINDANEKIKYYREDNLRLGNEVFHQSKKLENKIKT